MTEEKRHASEPDDHSAELDERPCVGAELAAKWRDMAHLSKEEAEEFAADIKDSLEKIGQPFKL